MSTGNVGPEAPEGRATRRARRLVAAALLVVVVAGGGALGARSYFDGGGRVAIRMGGTAGPVQVGHELHLLVGVDVDGTVRLRSAAAHLREATGAHVTVRLVHLDHGVAGEGSTSGPLSTDYRTVDVARRRLTGRPGNLDPPTYTLDVTVVPDRPGVYHLSLVTLTYDAGRFRRRTSRDVNPLCVQGTATPPTSSATGCDRG